MGASPGDTIVREPLARLAGEGGARRDSAGRVSAPPAPLLFGVCGALTLTRLAPLATLSRQAGEGFQAASLEHLFA